MDRLCCASGFFYFLFKFFDNSVYALRLYSVLLGLFSRSFLSRCLFCRCFFGCRFLGRCLFLSFNTCELFHYTLFLSLFERFKKVGDSKKFVYDDDLSSLVDDSLDTSNGVWKMAHIQFIGGDSARPTATVTLVKDDEEYTDCAIGNGPVNACFKAIDRITQTHGELVDYNVRATSTGQDALGEVSVKVQFGDCECSKPISGKGAATDVIEASARAYLNAVNRNLTFNALGISGN